MRTQFGVLLAVAVGCTSAPARAIGSWNCDRTPLVVTNARLWTHGKSLDRREIVVADGRIQSAGRAGSLRRPPGSRIIDARGAWLLPGLIDSHVHFGRAALLTGGLLPSPTLPSWHVTGRQTLASGVTTVRIHYSDMEKGPRWAREAAKDCDPSPTVLLGSGGLLGGKPSDAGWLPQVNSPQEARQKVRENAAVGATWITLHDTQKFTKDELAAIRDETRRARMGLISGGEPIEEAEAGLDAEADAIDHFDGSIAPAKAETLISRLERLGTYLIAPMGFFSRYNAYRKNPALIRRDAWVARRFDTQSVGEALVDHTRRRFESPPASEQQLLDGYAARQALFRRLLRSKIKLVAGTDSGSQGHFHGDAIWWELRAWHENGASVAQLLGAVTSMPAEMLRLPDRGTLKRGSRGDFVIYDGDLARGELELAKVRTVAKAGVLFVHDGRWVGPAEPGTAL